ncbi:MAG: hypothetical protein KGL39_08150 [Patescibacteria group bacterium]|nr:hypothetical protein [Patescibacteria group bacterium]
MQPSSPPSALRAQLLALADLLPALGNDADALTIIISRGGARLRFEFTPEELSAANGNNGLSAIEQAVLKAATRTPQTAKTLARLSGYSLSRVRDAITRLTGLDPPLLIRTPQGLRLP